MKFKEYYKHITGETKFSITGLRKFIFQTNKILKKLGKTENIILFLETLEIAVHEILKLDHGVLDLEDLLGRALFNELYAEVKFSENKVKMSIEDAEDCNQCKE